MIGNGILPERIIQGGIGDIAIENPCARDRDGADFWFASAILPPYQRLTKYNGELIPRPCLEGISTGQFSGALAALLGRTDRSSPPPWSAA